MPDIPKGAKRPQDHSAKAEATGEPIFITHNDVEYRLDADAFDDVETFSLLGRMRMSGDEGSLYISLIVERVLGPEQWAKFLRANRNDHGRVPGAALGGVFREMNEAAGNRSASSGS